MLRLLHHGYLLSVLCRCYRMCPYRHSIAAQVRCESSNAKSGLSADVTRRDVVVAGTLGAAGSQLASSSASAAAATQDKVTPVNISAKETMQLGKSGIMPVWPLTPPTGLPNQDSYLLSIRLRPYMVPCGGDACSECCPLPSHRVGSVISWHWSMELGRQDRLLGEPSPLQAPSFDSFGPNGSSCTGHIPNDAHICNILPCLMKAQAGVG